MSKSTARLSRLGVLAPAALAACMDASVLAAPAAGAIVSTLLNQLSKAFMLKKWFHGVMSAAEAEQLLQERGKRGSFLVRESRAQPGEFVLSVRVRTRVSHVMIRRQHDKYDIGSGEQFDDLVGLIEHLRAYPLVPEDAGVALRLLQPVSGGLRTRRAFRKPIDMQVKEDSKEVEDKYSLDREFQSIRMLEERHVFTTIEGNRPENMVKNRYRNIVPYDQTRVVLRARGAGDYINASFVRAVRLSDSTSSVQSSTESLNSVRSLILTDEQPKTPPLVTKSLSDDALMDDKRSIKIDMINGNVYQNTIKDKFYIATQGCLSNTKDDFWHMIWQEDIRIIAMITNEVEKGKVKCERYWPAPGQRERHGPLEVRGVAEGGGDHFVLRELLVSDARRTRTVYHYQFTTWPDHGTPSEPDGVLAFMEEINKRMYQIMNSENPPEQNVLCVHCSAGVGRTGTYIALDMLIDNIKSSGLGGSVDVRGAVRVARAQRGGMVQNAAQYRFLYRAVRSFLAARRLSIQRNVKVFEKPSPLCQLKI